MPTSCGLSPHQKGNPSAITFKVCPKARSTLEEILDCFGNDEDMLMVLGEAAYLPVDL